MRDNRIGTIGDLRDPESTGSFYMAINVKPLYKTTRELKILSGSQDLKALMTAKIPTTTRNTDSGLKSNYTTVSPQRFLYSDPIKVGNGPAQSIPT